MKSITFFICLVAAIFAGCTDNSAARKWGGTEDLQLPPNEILLGVTWKENSLWILTKDTTTSTSYFREKSSWGIVEGTVQIKQNQ